MKLLTTLFVASALFAQQPAPQAAQTSIVVTGTAEPIPLDEADRDIGAIPIPEIQRPLFNSWFDLLQLDSSLDLQQRALDGFQADLSIRGALFGQTLVLLDGLRLNDAQTGHFNLDLPIPLEMISSLEVLKGSGSAFYGSDAIGGVVNVLTQPIPPGELRLYGGLGNFGTNQQHVIASYGGKRWEEEMAASRDFSSGFIADRDYRNLALSSLSILKSRLGATNLLFAYADRPYGALDFYGVSEPQWERIKTWMVSAQQDLGSKTQASFAYRRHTDLYVYIRSDPSFYENRHLDQSYEGNLRRHDDLPLHAVLSYGMQGLAESINSTNLGQHSRLRGSAYAFYDLRTARRFSLSLGIREEVYGARLVETSPTLAGAYWFSQKFKLRAAASRAFRLPSFTDLYYSDPSDLGNPNLKPESATSYEAGLDAFLRPNLKASVTVFQRRDSNVIDYVRASPADIWQATNFDRLHFTGVETTLAWQIRRTESLGISFTDLHGVNATPEILESKYTLYYPLQNAVIDWRGTLPHNILLRTRIGVVNRLTLHPYAVWDASAAYATGRVRPFLELTNLTSTNYQEIVGVVMPGRGVVGGLEIYLFGGAK